MAQVLHSPSSPLFPITFSSKSERSWVIVSGVLAIIGGIFALLFPLVATLAVTQFTGILFFIGAVSYLMSSWQSRQASKWFYPLAIGLLFLLAGYLLLFNPVAGAFSLTILFIIGLSAQGVFEIAGSYMLWENRGAGWLAVSGVLSLVLAGMVLIGLPFTALWIVGLMMGINLISSGVAMIALASEAKIKPQEVLNA